MVNPTDYIFPAYFVMLLFMAALQPKALGTSIVAAVALGTFYPNWDYGGFVMLFYVAAYLLATFRS